MTLLYLLFAFLALFIWYIYFKKEAEETAIDNMRTMIGISNTTFENQLKDIVNVTALATVRSSNNLSTNIINILSNENLTDAEIIAYRADARDYLISLCSFKKNLNGLMISDFDGNSVVYGIVTDYNTIIKNGYLNEIKTDTDKMVFIEPHYSNVWYPNQNDLVFSVIRPVYSFSNKKVGFAIADVNCQLFHDSFDVNASSGNSLYVINDLTGKVIFSPQNNLLGLNDQDILNSEIRNQLSEDSGVFYITRSRRKLLVVYTKSSLTGWTTLSVIPQSEILRAFSLASHKILGITVFLILVLILLVFVFSDLLTKNIVTLTGHVKGINEENLDFPLTLKGNDEINELALQFKSMLSRIRQLLEEVKTSEAQKRKAEISALQFQMNPHFLYNALNTIKFLATLQGIENIEHAAESLSSLMHTNMDGRAYLTVAEDAAFIKSYLSIQKYRYTSAFTVSIHYSEETTGLLIPKLLVQPLVENALKHGLSTEQANGIILISYQTEDGKLHVRVEDNGIGITEERLAEIFTYRQNNSAGHIGIRNIQERIKLLFGNSYGIHIESQPGIFTRFDLYIPLLKKETFHEET